MNCFLCLKRIRKNKYELDYIGLVCSSCFRINKKKYAYYVDEIAKKNLEYINLELLNIKSNLKPFQTNKGIRVTST